MKPHRLVSIGTPVLRNDGKFVLLRLVTETAPEFPLEVATDSLGEFMRFLLDSAVVAGHLQGIAPSPPDAGPYDTVPLPTSGAGAMLGLPGRVTVAVRSGCVDMGFQLDAASASALGRTLVQLGTQAELEPRTPQ